MRRPVLVVLLVVALVAAAVGGWLLASGQDSPVAAPGSLDPEPEPGPVLLVTGYGGGLESVEPLAAALRAAGRDARVVPVVAAGTGDLREQAVALGQAAEAALAEGAESVDVVGFSAGGVVAHLWADGLADEDVLRRAVTLGSPHAGTDVARLALAFAPQACTGACLQLVPESPLLAMLGSEAPEAGRWTAIWTQDDEVVTPPSSGRLEGALAYPVQELCPGRVVEHRSLPADPVVQAAVLAALGDSEPAVPDDPPC